MKDLVSEFKRILIKHKVTEVDLPILTARIQSMVITHLAPAHKSRASLARALKLNRTTLFEKMKTLKIQNGK